MINKNENYFDFLSELNKRHQLGETWAELSKAFKAHFGESIDPEVLRNRIKRFRKHGNSAEAASKIAGTYGFTKNVSNAESYMQYNNDGTLEGNIHLDDDATHLIKDEQSLLRQLGYDPANWEVVTYRVTRWQQKLGDEPLNSVKYKIRPRTEVTPEEILKATQSLFAKNIKPFKVDEKVYDDSLNDRKLMEIAPIELHLGKQADKIESGENYDNEIAREKFEFIIKKICEKQEQERCGNAVLIIGSDFFNSESDYATSVHKIAQRDGSSWLKTFTEGLDMYVSAILTLRQKFNHIDVMLCAGNHATAKETYLYLALQQRFVNDDVVNFIENYRRTQVYSFGNCAIFYNHGDSNLKQVIKSIPAEFGKEWGSHIYRELHLGHLHKEVTVDDEGGMITRRIGSPCNTDAWHDRNRYVGAVKKHEIFIWNKYDGLNGIHYITF